MGERAQLLGRWAAHQALMRAWNTCVSKSGAASLQFGRQVPAGHWKPPFQHAVGLCSLSLFGFQWHLIFEDQTAMFLAGEVCFVSGLVLAFGRSWRRYPRPSLASWLTDGGLPFTAPCPLLLALETTSGSCPGLGVLPESARHLAEHPSGMKSRARARDFPREPAQSRTNGNRYKPQI